MVRTLDEVVENLRKIIERRNSYHDRVSDEQARRTLTAAADVQVGVGVLLLGLTDEELLSLEKDAAS
ncbi:MAG: hypothetical protein COU11_02190 [Candidatus Harrisonbacteria bacterium CG10_big_fil_rev_8_21_14_0_10_49_15]|uniref:Uncharacterized protein n=1 Tax=Candidatus Harrisonbacteria bacterium CG10_big_fil_rev_8_21_14_0_10_49_15 TaxID=1974587 RepID=A0A2H0UKT5_9BACT|nr:MAG: hypothetical protein COU11_02190 [Candidatus Harrisonbacteria bacterium CG10_big_fil_rev_8_21_14_0_10_49_15]